MGHPRQLLIWRRHLQGGTPCSRSKVFILRRDGKPAWEVRTRLLDLGLRSSMYNKTLHEIPFALTAFCRPACKSHRLSSQNPPAGGSTHLLTDRRIHRSDLRIFPARGCRFSLLVRSTRRRGWWPSEWLATASFRIRPD